MTVKKRILSCIVAASMMLVSAPVIGADNETSVLSPRSGLGINDGYLMGIVGQPTAGELSLEFDGEVAFVAPDGKTLSEESVVPSGTSVMADGGEIAKISVPGDASMDGKLNLTDASSILKKVAGWGNEICTPAADVDASGAVNLTDVSSLLKFIAGWDVTLGGEYLIDVRDGYKLLTDEKDSDEAAVLAGRIKEVSGIGLEIVSEAKIGDGFITFGVDLWNKYDFMEKYSGSDLYIDTYGGDLYISAGSDEALAAAEDYIVSLFDKSEKESVYRGYYGALADMNESSAKYLRAIRKIEMTPAVTDGTNGMNGDILAAITNANYTEPKNIIYMIGDGMGKNIAVATTYTHANQLYGGKLAMNYLPVEGRSTTYSLDQQITDSAAGGSALATGYKTSNGTIAMNGEHTASYKTLLELAAEKGKSTGIVATKPVTDATPASFTAHVNGRAEEVEIAGQQLGKLTDGSLDLVLGGGFVQFDNSANADALATAKDAGVTYTKSWAEAANSELPLLGLFGEGALATNGAANEPHIAEMTDLALDLLAEDEDGFFLMVEGSKIDSYGHSNEFVNETDETFEFDCAVAVAMRYVALNPDTVLIITADHETGELILPAEPTGDNILGGSRYASTGHHWTDVPVYAVGYGTEALAKKQENTDIAIFIAGLMGEDDFGQKNEVYSLTDLTSDTNFAKIAERNENDPHIMKSDDGVILNIGVDGFRTAYFPGEIINTPEDARDTVTAIRVTITNVGTDREYLPGFGVRMNAGAMYTAGDRLTYISPGETVTYTYNLNPGFRYSGSLAEVKEFMIYGLAGYSAEMLISDITVVSRPLDK